MVPWSIVLMRRSDPQQAPLPTKASHKSETRLSMSVDPSPWDSHSVSEDSPVSKGYPRKYRQHGILTQFQAGGK
jgi:hypothetical protein